MRIWTRDNMEWIEAPEPIRHGQVVRWAGRLWTILKTGKDEWRATLIRGK